MAIDAKGAVQDIDRTAFTKRLLADGQVLSRPPSTPHGLDPKKLEGVVIDDSQAERVGFESVSQAIAPFVGDGYRHDGGQASQRQSIIFRAKLTGAYGVRIAYTANPNRRKQVPVWITDAKGRRKILIDQTRKPTAPPFQSLGVFSFTGVATVEIRNDPEPGDSGFVIADAVQFIPSRHAK
jgi:hypothetical protein